MDRETLDILTELEVSDTVSMIHQSIFTALYVMLTAYENVEKRENAGYKNLLFFHIVLHLGNQHFFLFVQCFLPIPKRISGFKLHLFCRLQMLSIWVSLEICRLVES